MESNILERMSSAEIDDMFDRDGDVASIKLWLKERIEWRGNGRCFK